MNLMTRTQPNTLRLSRRPGNQFNPTNPPTTTLSNDSGNQTRVPNSITLPHVSRSLVFCFKTRDTRPKSNLYPFRRSITNFRLDPVRSRRYLTKSRLDLNKIRPYFCPISTDPARSRRIWLDFGQISLDPAKNLS